MFQGLTPLASHMPSLAGLTAKAPALRYAVDRRAAPKLRDLPLGGRSWPRFLVGRSRRGGAALECGGFRPS